MRQVLNITPTSRREVLRQAANAELNGKIATLPKAVGSTESGSFVPVRVVKLPTWF